MNRLALIIASALSVAVVLALIAFSARRNILRLEAARAELAATNAIQAAEIERLTTRVGEQEAIIEELLAKSENAEAAQKSLEDEMRAALQSKDVTISELQGKLTVNILDRILFDSGEAVLKEEGEKLLRQIAGVLTQHTNRQVHVIGHTDNVPIRRKFASNWELSVARAMAAVRFLQEMAGVDPRQLAAVGCGEFRPIAENSTAEGRARNRRIEVVVLPVQFAARGAEENRQPEKLPPAE